MLIHPKGNKAVILAIGFVALLVLGFYFLNNQIYLEKQENGQVIEPYQAQLTGEFVCLPHRDTAGPQTLECAFGIVTQTGEYYALDLANDPSQIADIQTKQPIAVNGTITPIEGVSIDTWDKYEIEGVFSVDTIEVVE